MHHGKNLSRHLEPALDRGRAAYRKSDRNESGATSTQIQKFPAHFFQLIRECCPQDVCAAYRVCAAVGKTGKLRNVSKLLGCYRTTHSPSCGKSGYIENLSVNPGQLTSHKMEGCRDYNPSLLRKFESVNLRVL